MEIYIDRNLLILKLDQESEEDIQILLDTLDNKDNIYSTKRSEHTAALNLSNFKKDALVYTLELDKYNDPTAIVVTILDSRFFAYDKNKLYYGITKLLIDYCEPCLSNARKELLVLCKVRLDLFNFSVSKTNVDGRSNSWLNNTILDYIDLDRIIYKEKTCCYDTREI